MPVSEHQVAANAVMAELWFNLLDGPRRALCELAYIDPTLGRNFKWQTIPVQDRVRLVRAMKALADVTIDCSVALEAARLSIENPKRASN